MSEKKKNKLQEIFSFSSQHMAQHLMYEHRLGSKFKKSFKYIASRLPIQDLKPLADLEWDEGKNYNWAIIKDGRVTLIIRHYRLHFTVFFRFQKEEESYYDQYGCFTIFSNTDALEDGDRYVEDNFIDMNELIKPLIKVIDEGRVFSLWNDYVLPRPKHVKIKIAWTGGEDINSLDKFTYCCEELFGKHEELFAEKEMFERIQSINEGDMLSVYKVTGISKTVKDGYYHGVGIYKQNTNFPDSAPQWADVYSLTRFYFELMFNKEENN